MESTRMNQSNKSAMIATLAVAVFILILYSAPYSPMYLSISTVFLFPILLFILSGRGGLQAALTGFILMAVANYLRMGLLALAMSTVYLLPVTMVLLYCLAKKITFLKTVIVLAITYTLSVLLLYVALNLVTNNQAYALAVEYIMAGLETLPGRDTLLYMMVNNGLLSLSGLAENTPIFDETTRDIVFLPNVLTELYAQARTRLDLLLRSLPPSLMTSFGIMLSSMGLYAGIAFNRRKIPNQTPEEQSRYIASPLPETPPFSMWHISRMMSLYLLPLAVIYLITMGMGGTMRLAGQMMFSVFTTIYSIQGLSVVNWWLRKFLSPVPLRMLALLLFYLVFQNIAFWIGLAEQLFDSRALRKKQTDHPFSNQA